MIVAILRHLEELKTKLEKLGYTVVFIEEYNYPVDAILYSKYMPDLSYITSNNIPDASNYYGIFMINVRNKTIDEIDNALSTRLYSPLF